MKYILTLLLTFGMFAAQAQELDCKIRIQAPNLQLVDPAIFKTLEADIYEFMNTRDWTEGDAFSDEERVECNINIAILEEISQTSFKGELTIQASRPVYNSTYESVIFLHNDKDFDFEYAQYQPLNFNINAYNGELTSVLAFYAYMILGFDYDSYAPEGGSPWFVQARQIVQNANDQGRKGWKAFDGTRNRYWMIENQLDPKFSGLRAAYYDYHRKGLDVMHKDADLGRAQILSSLQKVEKVSKNNPNSMGITVFSNTKSDEIFDIFNYFRVPNGEKTKVGTMMVRVDPANAQRFLSLGKTTSNSGGRNMGSQTVPRPGSGGSSLPSKSGKTMNSRGGR